jgi:hypothetical protein
MPRLFPILLLAVLAPMPALAQTEDNAPSKLESSPQLRHDKGESWTYVKPGLDLTKYNAVLIEPATVYKGADAQFKNIEAADRAKFAELMTSSLRSEIGKKLTVAPQRGPGVLRIKVTLLGAEKTTGGVSTAAHVMPIGLVSNAVKSVAGKKGSFTGSVLLAVEVEDSVSGQLLAAAVRRKFPDALDIEATASTSDTVKAVARDLAKDISERLEKRMHAE